MASILGGHGRVARTSERVSFVGGAGFKLAGIVDLPDNVPRAVVIFTHCFTCSKDLKAIVRISRGLAEAGYLVLRYDLTGLGGSEGNFSQTNFRSNRDDLQSAARFMSDNYEPPSFLIGHSFGGACSLSMAQELSTVLGVVALAAPSDTSHLADLLHRMDPAIQAMGTGTVAIGGRSYTINKQMLLDFRSYDLSSQLRKLAKPTLLLHSPADETVHFDHVLRLYGLLTQRADDSAAPSAASLICLPDADHLLVKNPADLQFVTQMISAWFDRLLAK